MKRRVFAAAVTAGMVLGLASCGKKETAEEGGASVLRFSAIPDADTTAQAEKYLSLIHI